MRPLLTIAFNDLRILFKDWVSVLLNLVVIPIAISLAAGAANGAFGSSAPSVDTRVILIDVIDQDQTDLSTRFLSAVRASNERLVLCPLDDMPDQESGASGACELDAERVFDEAVAIERLQSQTTLALLIIPAGFESALNNNQPVTIQYRSNESASAPSYILESVQAAVQQVGGAALARQVGLTVADQLDLVEFADETDRAAFGENVRQRAETLWSAPPVSINVVSTTLDPIENTSDASSGGFNQSFPGIGTMYAMFAVLPLMAAIIDERRNGTLQRMTMMPLSRAQVLGGKLLARFLVGMIQYAIVFGVGFLIGVRYGDDPFALILLMVTFVFCLTALALAFSTLIKTSAQAAGISIFLSLTLAPLGGAWWPLEIVPDWMRMLGHISPVAWVMDGYQRLMFFDGGLVDVLPMLAVLIGMGVLLFIIGISRFRFS